MGLLDRITKLFGSRLDSPEVAAFLAEHGLKAPKPTTDANDRVTATDKANGFELYFTHRIDARPYFPPKKQGRGYVAYLERVLIAPAFPDTLPRGLPVAGATRAQLVKALGEPYAMRVGSEMFKREDKGIAISATWSVASQTIGNIWLGVPTGREIRCSPLHFETAPPEGKPPHAELNATGILAAWAADRLGLVPALAKTARAKQLAKREITGRQFLVDELGGGLLTKDFVTDDDSYTFLIGYTSEFADDVRKGVESYDTDYRAAVKGAVKNPYLVPDSWEAFDRVAPIIDARWADYQKTKFQGKAPAGLYEAAAKKRDAVTLASSTPTAKQLAVPADTTEKLMATLGRATSDPEVKALLVSLGLPVGKTIDQQASPQLGVSYMAVRPADKSKMPAGASPKAVVIERVTFQSAGQTEYVRGLGMKVEYLTYAGSLPKDLAFGMARAAVRKKLGKPTEEADDSDWWSAEERALTVRYNGTGVCTVAWSMPAKWSW